MATEYIKLRGYVRYVQAYEPDNYMGASNWKLDFFPEDDAEWEKFNKSGIQKTVKENTDPAKNSPVGKFFQLIRPTYKLMKGKVVNFTGPYIENERGETILDYIWKDENKRASSYEPNEKDKIEKRGSPVNIGNGSKVEVTVAVYDTFKGKGHRFEGIRILDLIEYESGPRGAPPLAEGVKTETTPIEEPKEAPKEKNKDKGKAPW